MAKRRLKRYLYYNLYTFTSLSETTRPRFIVVISWLAHPFFFFFFPRFGELRGNGSSARPGTTSSCVRIMCLPIVGARYDHFPRKPLARRLAGLYAASGTHLFLRLACIPMSWLITERAGREEALRDCVASGVSAKACPAWTFQRLRATLRFCFGSAANKR